MLDVNNAEDETYSAFAALEVLSSTTNYSLARLIQYVPGGKEAFVALWDC